MREEDKILLALRILGSTDRVLLVNKLSTEEMDALGIATDFPVVDLYLGDGDTRWRGKYLDPLRSGAEVQVGVVDVRERAVAILAPVLALVVKMDGQVSVLVGPAVKKKAAVPSKATRREANRRRG